MFTQKEIDKISTILDEYPQVTVLSDEVYFHLAFDKK
jgi:aspartate/methionine/tyrosine aminotransferase